MQRKLSAVTSGILLDVTNDTILKELISGKALFKVLVFVDKDGTIKSYRDASYGISDTIGSKFINLLKRNKDEVYIPLIVEKNKEKDYYIRKIKEIQPPYMVMYIFPASIFTNEEKNKIIKEKSGALLKEIIKKRSEEYMKIQLKTSKDYGITEKDF